MNLKIAQLQLGEQPVVAGVLTDSDLFGITAEVRDSLDVVELRVDMFDSVETGHVADVFKKIRDLLGKPVIGTVRDAREGGQRTIDDRLELYDACIPWCDAVDVEVQSNRLLAKVGRLLSRKGKLLIGSYHNFNETPDEIFMDSIVSRGKEGGADIVKIAVTAKGRDDLLRLLLFTFRHRDKGMITMSMGDAGLPSRVVGPLFGSLISYGYVGRPSAPGQLSVSELMDLFRKLKLR
ncbi:MAG TPA: type I 3-dehydroquinate dehydratase [Dissulfurispiraceae bacterium]|nr:type I 3-dehydroquinate dehydratase [Dissulfurispiraceae bacterium]